ncbi:MAG: FmdB family zinc ribbon protein [Solirubrobacterales bacterium]
MPIYEYRCENGHTFEALQSFSDDPLETCEVCGAPVERVLHPVAVHFKGSGFYSTDYAGKGKEKQDGGDGASGDSGSDGKSDWKGGSKKSGSSSNGSGDSSKAKAGSDSD